MMTDKDEVSKYVKISSSYDVLALSNVIDGYEEILRVECNILLSDYKLISSYFKVNQEKGKPIVIIKPQVPVAPVIISNIPIGRIVNRMRTNLIYQRTRRQARK